MRDVVLIVMLLFVLEAEIIRSDEGCESHGVSTGVKEISAMELDKL